MRNATLFVLGLRRAGLCFFLCCLLTAESPAGGPPPVIIVQPLGINVPLLGVAIFTVVASSGTTLSYQWYFGNSAISGATSSTLTLLNVSSANAGTYYVAVKNAGGTVNSSQAALTVMAPPSITTQPQSLTVAVGQNTSLSVVAAGNAPLSYQWQLNGTTLAGATSSTLAYTDVQTTNAGSYNVVVTNPYGSATSMVATLTVYIAPAITTQPLSQTVYASRRAAFSVAATGAAPLSYQWMFNGRNLSGATGSTLAWTNAQTNNAGSYTVMVTNIVGSVTSAVATLTVIDGTFQFMQQWTAQYNGSWNGPDYIQDTAVDAQGNVYVTGYADMIESKSWDYVTIKYDSAGNPLWRAVYNGLLGNGNDQAKALALDSAGNVYVTGSSQGKYGWDYATVKYDPNGNQLWVARYDGAAGKDDFARALAVDTNGNVFVTGSSRYAANSSQYATVKYDSAGNQLWVQTYIGPGASDDDANSIAVDSAGNVYVTGQSKGNNTGFDYATIKYSNDGTQLWVARYDGPASKDDLATNVVVDAAGNVYVTGTSINTTNNSDYATVKYDSNGNQLWVARYDGPAGGNDYAVALAVDGAGNVFVTGASAGTTGPIGSADYATVKYSPLGQQLWVQRYDYGDDDQALALALDPAGDVYVTGKSRASATGYDFATVKYRSADGAQRAVARYNSFGNVNDTAVAIAVDSQYNVYVAGQGFNPLDYILVKYQPSFLAPNVSTLGVSNVTTGSAVLNAAVNPQGAATAYCFQYGLTTNYGSLSATNALAPGTNSTAVATSIAGLVPGTLYHYCVEAANTAATTAGQDATFTTTYAPPTASTLSASNVAPGSAVLNAVVNPQGAATTCYFQYGVTTNYGSLSATTELPASTGSPDPAASSPVTAPIVGLAPGTVYHYCFVATSAAGMTMGQDATFTTLSLPPVQFTGGVSGQGTGPGGKMQLSLASVPGASFTVLSSTNVAQPLSNWTVIGSMTESSPGLYQFTDSQPPTNPQCYYCIRSP